MRFQFVIAAVAGLIMTSASQAQQLNDTSWEPVSLDGTDFTPLQETFVQFDQEGRFFGKDGCNSIRGRFVTNGDAILFGPAAATMMACPQEVMDQAQAYTKALMAARLYTLEGDDMTLLDADGKELVRLQKRDGELR